MYKESSLENGLKILTYEDKSVPIVDIELAFKAGSRYEENNQKGYAHILEHMLLKGTTKRPSPVLISKEIDDKGGYKNAHTSRESLSIVIQAADNYSEELFELLSDMLLNSLIDPKVLENEKKIIIEEKKKSDDNIESFLTNFTYEKLFSGHPLASNILGDMDSILSANVGELKKFKEKFLVPNNSVLIVVGNITHDNVVVLAKKYFGEWSGKIENLPLSELMVTTNKHYFSIKDTKQTLIAYNLITVPVSKNREVLALDLIQNFLNFGGSSVLKEELRHKRGLIYSVSANIGAFSDTGFFSIRTSTTKPKETTEAISEIIGNLKNLFTDDKLVGIKSRRIGAFKRYIANPYHQVDFILSGFRVVNKLVTPEEFITEINNITYEEVVRVIDKYLTPEKAVVTAIGPEDFIY